MKTLHTSDVRLAERSALHLYRGVSDAELLRAHGLFVAEGRFIVRRVLTDRRYRVHSVLVNEAAHRQLADLLDDASGSNDVPVVVATPDQFAEMTGYDIHRGCLALVHRPPARAIDDLIATGGTLLVLEAIANADNVGGAFRNAAAFGAAGVVLGRTVCDPLYRKAVRTSMGAALTVPFARAADLPRDLIRAREAGYTIVALAAHPPSETLDACAAALRGRKLAMVAGAEGAGITPEVDAIADVRVRIPIACAVDSLNVAVAIGIALHALA
jgi:tRNA G18 (ribose-2'-O)-methylase SpoU